MGVEWQQLLCPVPLRSGPSAAFVGEARYEPKRLADARFPLQKSGSRLAKAASDSDSTVHLIRPDDVRHSHSRASWCPFGCSGESEMLRITTWQERDKSVRALVEFAGQRIGHRNIAVEVPPSYVSRNAIEKVLIRGRETTRLRQSPDM
jgi:hypothetical protein